MNIDCCLPKDCRQTKIRHAIMGVLVHSSTPLTATEILNTVKTHVSSNVNKTTIYRQLKFLHQKQLINVIEANNNKHYQLSQNTPKALFFCSNCHQFFELKSSNLISPSQIDKISSENNFQINNHLTTFFGTCGQCQSTN